MKYFQLGLTVAIILTAIQKMGTGESPTWVGYFCGWGIVLIRDIFEVLKNDTSN